MMKTDWNWLNLTETDWKWQKLDPSGLKVDENAGENLWNRRSLASAISHGRWGERAPKICSFKDRTTKTVNFPCDFIVIRIPRLTKKSLFGQSSLQSTNRLPKRKSYFPASLNTPTKIFAGGPKICHKKRGRRAQRSLNSRELQRQFPVQQVSALSFLRGSHCLKSPVICDSWLESQIAIAIKLRDLRSLTAVVVLQ